MSKVHTNMATSLDGFAAGVNQTADKPFGDGVGEDGAFLHRWMFDEADLHTRAIDRITDAGAFIMGRNMFGPGRGAWDESWKGWWGDDPPYHAPVFVLSHHEREPVEMLGGTTYHFVTDGIESALAQAREAAGGKDVAIAGGANTVNQYLAAGLIDELRLHVTPVLVGRGERLLHDVGAHRLELVEEPWGSDIVTHLTYRVVR
jgi:dihydrofolate reductase